MRSIVGVVVAAPKATISNGQAIILSELVEQVVPCSFGEATALCHLAGCAGRFGAYQIVGTLYQ